MAVTANDVVWRLTLYLGGNASTSAQREVRTAIVDAHRELADAFAWRCLHKFHIFTTNASVTTGTASFDLTGGSSERLWTFSNAIVPTWADRAYIYIGNNSWPLNRRLSSTTAQSPTDVYPAADIAATTFEIYQNEYLLPSDFLAAGVGMEEAMGSAFSNTADSMAWLNRQNPMGGNQWTYTVNADRHLPQRLSITLGDWPTESKTFAFLYRRRPRRLKYFGTEAGACKGLASLSGTTVTGSGTAFAADMVGSIIRFSPNATAYPEDETGNNPYAFEGVIDSVTDSSTCTVRSNTDTVSVTNVKYVVSDPVDLRDTMLTAFFRCCEKHVEVLRQREGAGKGDATMLYMDALRTAKGADKFSFDVQSLIPDHVVTIADLERQRQCGADM